MWADRYQIRPMLVDELDRVAWLFHDLWHETQAKLQDPRKAAIRGIDFFQGRMDMPKVQTLVALEKQTIIGFARWEPGHLHSLFVAQAYRSMGFGEKLCDAVVAENHLRMGDPLQLDCVEGNWAARRFYERQGWRVSETIDSIDETAEGQIVVRHWVMLRGHGGAS